jgi:carbamoyltransferase
MYILGISALYHDSAAALIEDGVLVAAAQEERFTRKKFDHRFPESAIDFCLKTAGISVDDLDYVVFYEKPLPKFERILLSYLSEYPRSWNVFRESMISWLNDKLWMRGQLLKKVPVPNEKVLFADHHLSHAASAMFTSPFKEAAVLTLDGVGEWTTTALGFATADWGDGEQTNHIEFTKEMRFPHSLGLLYSVFTAWLGFRVNSGEYKVMGMAPYGTPKYIDKVKEVIKVYDDGSFRLNPDYISYHYSLKKSYSKKFLDLFGPPRQPESYFFTAEMEDPTGREEEERMNQYYADVAASIQRVVEEVILKIVNHLHEITGSKNLVMAGGVSLNSVANGRIMREGPFDNVFIHPNAGDAGGALGAALFAYHVLLKKPRSFVMEHAYYGQEYSDEEIKAFLDEKKIDHEYVANDDDLALRAVDAILNEEIVALFTGRFEWGPRALGNRSILADPRRDEVKDIVNEKIKFREPFRPFAPVVIEEAAGDYFELGKAKDQHPIRYMLMVSPIPEARQSEIPAVCHMGTGRLQTVREEWNPIYYKIIKTFGDKTGTPVLLNTSFNLRGEPIVTTPANAYHTFSESGIDMLVMGHYVIHK